MNESLVFAESNDDDFEVEGALRPTSLKEFIGQDRVKSQLGLVLVVWKIPYLSPPKKIFFS